MSSTELSNGSL